jgi:hypothetical protein
MVIMMTLPHLQVVCHSGNSHAVQLNGLACGLMACIGTRELTLVTPPACSNSSSRKNRYAWQTTWQQVLPQPRLTHEHHAPCMLRHMALYPHAFKPAARLILPHVRAAVDIMKHSYAQCYDSIIGMSSGVPHLKVTLGGPASTSRHSHAKPPGKACRGTANK